MTLTALTLGNAARTASATAPAARSRKKRLSFAERREFDAILPELDSLETEKSSLEALFSTKGVPTDDLRQAHARYLEVDALIGEKTLRWEELALQDSSP